jgi:hypothetical protein
MRKKGTMLMADRYVLASEPYHVRHIHIWYWERRESD